MSTAVSFAFAAGLLATVNPCGFTMLPSFLTFYLGAHEQDGASRSLLARVREGLTVGAVLSLAFGAVFVVVGLLVSAGLRPVIKVVPWLAVAVAVGLLAVGAAMLAGRHVGLMSASRVTVTPGTGGGYRRVALFGVTYALASLSCTLAVFVVGQALAVADPVQLVVVFAAYAAGSASLLIALSVSAALAKVRWRARSGRGHATWTRPAATAVRRTPRRHESRWAEIAMSDRAAGACRWRARSSARPYRNPRAAAAAPASVVASCLRPAAARLVVVWQGDRCAAAWWPRRTGFADAAGSIRKERGTNRQVGRDRGSMASSCGKPGQAVRRPA